MKKKKKKKKKKKTLRISKKGIFAYGKVFMAK